MGSARSAPDNASDTFWGSLGNGKAGRVRSSRSRLGSDLRRVGSSTASGKGRSRSCTTQRVPGEWPVPCIWPPRRWLPPIAPLRPFRDRPHDRHESSRRSRPTLGPASCLRARPRLRRAELRHPSLHLQSLAVLRSACSEGQRRATAGGQSPTTRGARLWELRRPVREQQPKAPVLRRSLSLEGVDAAPAAGERRRLGASGQGKVASPHRRTV
jgi:hypothetical protein